MPFPSAGPWVHTTLMTSTVVREKQELLQGSGEIIPDWPSAIVKDAGGEIPPLPCWECHNGQELYLLAKSTTV